MAVAGENAPGIHWLVIGATKVGRKVTKGLEPLHPPAALIADKLGCGVKSTNQR